jgi:hypothetical protein
LKTTELTRHRDSLGQNGLSVGLQRISQAITNKSLKRQPRLLGSGTEDAFSRDRWGGRDRLGRFGFIGSATGFVYRNSVLAVTVRWRLHQFIRSSDL